MYSVFCSSILYFGLHFGLHSVNYTQILQTQRPGLVSERVNPLPSSKFWTEPKPKALADDEMNVPQLVISVFC